VAVVVVILTVDACLKPQHPLALLQPLLVHLLAHLVQLLHTQHLCDSARV
jgi:hypothetical protein